MSGDRYRIDAVGWLQLVGVGVLGAGVWVLFARWPGDWTLSLGTVVIVGIAIAIGLPVAQVISWAARGGRAAMVETGEWVRAGGVPVDVPEEEARARLARFARDHSHDAFSAIGTSLAAVLWFAIAVPGGDRMTPVAVLWGGMAVVQMTTWLRWRGPIKRWVDRPAPLVRTE